ncbi:hypothetical protein EMIT0P258_100198 [Pseudomonas sp. IT-P258]
MSAWTRWWRRLAGRWWRSSKPIICGKAASLWRGSLLPLGREAAPKPGIAVIQVYRIARVYDCFAAEREQAPSPQIFVRCRRFLIEQDYALMNGPHGSFIGRAFLFLETTAHGTAPGHRRISRTGRVRPPQRQKPTDA